jgi:hypothetical protein
MGTAVDFSSILSILVDISSRTEAMAAWHQTRFDMSRDISSRLILPYYTPPILSSPILSLSDELLGYILEYASEYRHETSPKPKPENLLLVCKRWYDVAMCAPRVWSWIVVDAFARDKEDEMFLPMVNAYLERSKAAPLHVFFLMGDMESDEQWEDEVECMLELIGEGGKHMGRWASLHLCLAIGDQRIMDELVYPTPLLSRLDIPMVPEKQYRTNLSACFPSVPPIAFASTFLEEGAIYSNAIYESTQSLTILNASPAPLLEALPRFVALETLRLEEFTEPYDEQLPTHPVSLAGVTTLIISYYDWFQFLHFIELPKLRTLVVDGPYARGGRLNIECGKFFDSMLPHVRGLRRLQLSGIVLDIDPWREFLEAAEELRELEAKNVPYLDELLADEDEELCPRLKVAIFDGDPLHRNWLEGEEDHSSEEDN